MVYPTEAVLTKKKVGFCYKEELRKVPDTIQAKQGRKKNTIAKRQRWIPRHFCNSMPQTKCPRNV